LAAPEPRAAVVDVGDADFDRSVVERSAEVPVVVDFWAPWCGPCRALTPLLEALAQEHAGAFVLARVNVDEASETAARFGVRSVPTVVAVREGAIAGEFVGAQPEPVVRRFVDSALPTEADRRAREGDAWAPRDPARAEAEYRAALAQDGRHARALVGLARLLVDRGDPEADREADDLLARVLPDTPVSAEAEQLAALLRTRSDTEGGEDVEDLRRRVAEAPDDLAARLHLGRALGARGHYDEALEQFLAVVKRDPEYEDQAARRAMLDLFAVMGSEDPLVERYRGELARALFR